MVVWLAKDLMNYTSLVGSSELAANRVFYTLVGTTDIPVVPVVLGSFLAGLMSPRRSESVDSKPQSARESVDFTQPKQ